MINWNGSVIDTPITVHDISTYEGRRYAQIKIDDSDRLIPVIYASGSTSLLCITDELKPLFSVPKTGTLRIPHGSTYQVIYDVGKQIYDLSIPDNIHISAGQAYTLRMIQRLLVFRDLMGVSPNQVSHIKIRMTDSGFEYPVSCSDKFPFNKQKGIMKQDYSPLSSRVLDEWFVEHKTTPDEVFRQMIPKIDMNNLSEIIHKIKNKIDEVIHRIDPTYSWYRNYLYEKIQNRIINSQI